VSEIGSRSVVVQRLAEYPAVGERAGAVAGGDSRGNPEAKSEAASESLSCLQRSERCWTEGATAAEVEVVGTCVYYYLPEAGHDARSRIGTKTCVQFGGSCSDWGRQGVVQCRTGTSGMWALPRVWRRKRFIVYSPLVGDPARIWIASSQIAVRMLQFSYVDVRRRRSDRLRQRHPGSEEDADGD
jgi:hypothetical protein